MKRIHLFEIEDQSWCPQWLREGITGYLRLTLQVIRPYEPLVGKLTQAMRLSNERELVDLCSGSGGSWPHLLATLEKSGACTRLALTDKFPNPRSWEKVRTMAPSLVRCETASVDATAVPERVTGFRTLFTAFHHFSPGAAHEILADAVRREKGIAIFEFTHRGPLALFLMCFTGILCLLVTPFIRPFRWSRLFWTYAVPVIPLAVTWDGLVSCLRTYDVAELEALAHEADPDATHEWEIGEISSWRNPVPVTYLIGRLRCAPARESSAA